MISFPYELQESVVTTIVKLCLKSLQEFVRLQTFNRSGFQQIQLDIQFIRIPIRELVDDEAAIDFLLDEVGKIVLLLVIINHGDAMHFFPMFGRREVCSFSINFDPEC